MSVTVMLSTRGSDSFRYAFDVFSFRKIFVSSIVVTGKMIIRIFSVFSVPYGTIRIWKR